MATTVTNGTLSGSDISVHISKQTTKDAINASPVFIGYERKEGRGKTTVSYTKSEMVKSNRQGRQSIQDGVRYGADISSELNKQAVDDMIGVIHSIETIVDITDTDIAATVDGFTGVGHFAGLSAGDYFWVSGFTDSTIDGVYEYVTGDDDSVVTRVAPAATETAGASVSIYMGKSVNAKDQTFYTIQTRAPDLSKAGNIDYHTLYNGIANSMPIEIPERGVASYSIAFLAEKKLAGTAAIAGQTDLPALTDRPISAVQNIVDYFIDGVSQVGIVKSMSIEHNNNYGEDDASGENGSLLYYGDYDLSGSISVRSLKDNPFTWRDYSEAGTPISIAVLWDHNDSGQTLIKMPRTIVTEAPMADGSNVMANSDCSFAAEEDPATSATCIIYRNWV